MFISLEPRVTSCNLLTRQQAMGKLALNTFLAASHWGQAG